MAEHYRGYTIKIEQDEDPPNPRTDFDPWAKFWFWHRRDRFGDDDAPKESMTEKEVREYVGEPIAYLTAVNMYDHSGQYIYAAGERHPYFQHEAWDAGQIGWAFITLRKMQEEGRASMSERSQRRQGKKVVLQEIEEYSQYVRGDIWRYEITSDDDPEMDDSSGGYFGYDYCLKEAKNAVDYHIARLEQEAWERQPQLEAAVNMGGA